MCKAANGKSYRRIKQGEVTVTSQLVPDLLLIHATERPKETFLVRAGPAHGREETACGASMHAATRTAATTPPTPLPERVRGRRAPHRHASRADVWAAYTR